MTDRKRLVQTLVGVHAFYDKELTEFAIRVWEDALDGVPIASAEAAFRRHLSDTKRGQFMPKPADILRQLKGDEQDRALIAWGQVLTAARSGGGMPDACQATREALQAMGGMSVICRANESENGFLQKRFLELFSTYSRRDETPPLLGTDNVVKIGHS